MNLEGGVYNHLFRGPLPAHGPCVSCQVMMDLAMANFNVCMCDSVCRKLCVVSQLMDCYGKYLRQHLALCLACVCLGVLPLVFASADVGV